jgi:class 3 adenylate cyclase/tetratricopeptide (TPR) repeat protein
VCGYETADSFRFCPECGAAAADGARQQRKVVTVLFCDVVGSTALGESRDAEAVRAVLARYFEQAKSIVERHGGTVEKFIGDAVMAIFGVPTVREDDALRAVRTAAEMRNALPELDVQARIGVNTGEVVTGTAERLATGDAVNVAARLEQAAQPGEVLLSAPTLALVRDAVEVEEVEPLALKGKAEPVAAYRLLRVQEAPERRHETRFVGRELALLRGAWERVQTERCCELVTIVADAGVGKSRLVAEALAPVDTRVVRGRCLPYGEGITYWPVVEVLKQLGVLPADDAAAAAIRSLLGETAVQTSAEEIAWAVRKTFEQAASERPLTVVFDDVHWAEETFLDLIEHVALLSTGAPILLACLARPKLTERRPEWPVTLRLEPLLADDVEELIPQRFGAELRERIARAAGGNPLFITEMLAMTSDAPADVIVPPTLQALLAARLDQLTPSERGVLERGAVEGEIFHRGAVQALAPDEPQVTPRLAALVRKELIKPEAAQLPGEDGFRFRHLLIRDAAYDALAKATRAELHERFAHWLEEHGAALVELDEILGYHFEQAYRYRRELGLDDDGTLAAAARRRLTAAGVRARVRGDELAAVNLLERAVALVPADAIDLTLELNLLEALYWAGRGSDAVNSARSLVERAAAAGDRIAELCARIKGGLFRLFLEPEGATERLAVLLDEALPEFEKAGDDAALYVAYAALGQVRNMQAQTDAMREAYERAAAHAQRAGGPSPDEFLNYLATGRFYGTTPVSELLAWLDEQEARGVHLHGLDVRRSLALAMLGRFNEAQSIMRDVRTKAAERGGGFALAYVLGQPSTELALLADDPAAAAESSSEAMRLYDEFGERFHAPTAAGRLGQALYELGRLAEAETWAGRAAELGATDDAWTQMLWRQVKAKVLARRGEHAEAERLAREALAIGEETDLLNSVAEAYGDLGEVLALAGRADEAAAASAEALARYERKENLVMAERTRVRLAKKSA